MSTKREHLQSYRLQLTALRIEFKEPTFRGWLDEYEEGRFSALKADERLFAYRYSHGHLAGMVLTIPLTNNSPEPPQQMEVAEHRVGLAALVKFRLPIVLERLKLKRRPFYLERVNRQDDIVESAFYRLKMERPPKLAGFHLHSRTRFSIRVIDEDGHPALAVLAVEFGFRQSVPDLQALLRRDLNLRGIDLLRRREKEQSLYLGEVVKQEGQRLWVTGPNGAANLLENLESVYAEPSQATFNSILRQVVSRSVCARYEQAEWEEQSARLSGQGALKRFAEVKQYLARQGPLQLARSVIVRFGNALETESLGAFTRPAYQLPEVEYRFAPGDSASRSKIPSKGLNDYGPFDGQRFTKKSPRVLVVYPAEEQSVVERFCHQLFDGVRDSKNFKRGFVGTYRLARVIPQFVPVRLTGVPSSQAAECYREELRTHFDPAREPDLAITVLKDEDAFASHANPYVATKAYLLNHGIPNQNVRMLKINADKYDLAYIAEDMALAMYAKLGGTPWTIEPPSPLVQELVVGMGWTSVGNRNEERTRFVGITTIFSSNGAYMLASATPRCRLEEFPDVFRETLVKLLSRLKTDEGWTEGDVVRLVFHAREPLKRHDIADIGRAAVSELGTAIRFECAYLTVTKSHPFTIFALDESGRKARVETGRGLRGWSQVAERVPRRGVVMEMGDFKHLLCVSGHLLARRAGEPIPQPLMITLHPDSNYRDMRALVQQVYQFTGLSWRSTRPSSEPVTIGYSRQIARRLGELDRLGTWNDELLDTRLRKSRWFL